MKGWSYHFAARIVNVAQLGGADFHEAYRVEETVEVGDGASWHREWQAAGERIEERAQAAQRAGRPITARDAYLRAHLLDWLMEEVNRPRGQTKFP